MDAEAEFELSTWEEDGVEPNDRNLFVLVAEGESTSIVMPTASDFAAEPKWDGSTESRGEAGTSGSDTKALAKRRRRDWDEDRSSGAVDKKSFEVQERRLCPRPGCVVGLEEEGIALSMATKSTAFLRGMVHLTKARNRFLQKALNLPPEVKRTFNDRVWTTSKE